MTRRRLILIITATVSSLILSIAPTANQGTPVQAAVNWTKYTGDITLDSQKYVIDAWVLKDGSTYRMWYTHGKTDLTISEFKDNLGAGQLNLDEILDDLADRDLEELLDDLANLDAGDILDFFDATTTVIGYATSTNGIDWTVKDEEVLAGGSSGIQCSVGAPCVIEGGSYKMWYTHTKIDLTEGELQDILDDIIE